MEEEAKKEELNTQELDPSSPGGRGQGHDSRDDCLDSLLRDRLGRRQGSLASLLQLSHVGVE